MPSLSRRTPTFGLSTALRSWSFQLSKLRQLLLRNHFQALGSALQSHDLARRELARLPRRNIQPQCSVTYSTDLFYMMSDLFEHLPDLPVPPLGQCHLVPWVLATANQFHLCRRGHDPVTTAGANLVQPSAVNRNPTTDLLQRLFVRNTADLYQVGFLDTG